VKASNFLSTCRSLRTLAMITALLTAGCATIAPNRDTPRVQVAVTERGYPAVDWTAALSTAPAGVDAPLTREAAVALAFRRGPRILELYAQLGVSQAEVIDASRLENPEISYARLRERGSGAAQITRGISLPFSELLLLPLRSKLAGLAFESERERVGAELVDLATDVEAAWLDYVTAQQAAEMRKIAAESSGASAELAQRLHEAGNLPARTLALELAEAGRTRIDAARAQAGSLEARAALAALLGLRVRDAWTTVQQLPAPPSEKIDAAALEERALAERMDLAAARRDAMLATRALDFTRRWRWLGLVQVGYESESETDGALIRGPVVSWQIPFFNGGRGVVMAQESAAQRAQATLSAKESGVRNQVSLAVDRLSTEWTIAESYRTALLPQRETVAERTLEEYNYMLVDAFELLQAKRETYQAYQEYLEAVRDFWKARGELRRAVGGRLPEGNGAAAEAIGAESLLGRPPAGAAPAQDNPHSHHEVVRP
jgi:outer membrane protein, heavy metal efflux system